MEIRTVLLVDDESDPVIFLTARARPHEIDRYLALGAVGVIAKPFDPLHLPRRIIESVQSR